jgi:hypothetical protein
VDVSGEGSDEPIDPRDLLGLNGRLPAVEYEDERLEEGLRSVPMEVPQS